MRKFFSGILWALIACVAIFGVLNLVKDEPRPPITMFANEAPAITFQNPISPEK